MSHISTGNTISASGRAASFSSGSAPNALGFERTLASFLELDDAPPSSPDAELLPSDDAELFAACCDELPPEPMSEPLDDVEEPTEEPVAEDQGAAWFAGAPHLLAINSPSTPQTAQGDLSTTGATSLAAAGGAARQSLVDVQDARAPFLGALTAGATLKDATSTQAPQAPSPHAPMMDGAVSVTVGDTSAPAQQNLIGEQNLWSLWSERRIDAAPSVIQPPALVDQSAEASPATSADTSGVVAASNLTELGGQMGRGGAGANTGQGQSSDPRDPKTLVQRPIVGEKFEAMVGTVDVMVATPDEGTSSVAPPRARAVSSAIREMIASKSGGLGTVGASQARIELCVDGETIVIHVRLKDGVVDVDVSGLSQSELGRVREELQERLPQSGMDLGDMTEGREDDDVSEGDAQSAPVDEAEAPSEDELGGAATMLNRAGRIWLRA